ncbi:hypothetical protein [Microbacterium sp.]|uniref:hypothetical protein n=1 Tax=Microbacterium sp. TaxID=51671 RepID=UPI002E377876|nr:hypothetical protein [Microbacterium sp.]HEX5729105.1 hypothetical protein [Microbacterium sp.]
MTAISADHAAPTAFERTLLNAASALDAFVAVRLERRDGAVHRRLVEAQAAASALRVEAEAERAIGLLPR